MDWELAAAAVAIVGIVAVAVRFWPKRRHAGYPLAELVAGDVGPGCWQLEPAELEAMIGADAPRLEQAIARLERAAAHTAERRALLAATRADEIDAAQRAEVRSAWSAFADAMLAVDAIQERYEAWYGVDYADRAALHARAFALCFGALCAQVRAGQGLAELLPEGSIAPTLFDEAVPELGLPAGSWRALCDRLVRTRDGGFVPLGAAWYASWIAEHLELPDAAGVGARLAKLCAAQVAGADSAVARDRAGLALRAKIALMKGEALARVFPVQRAVAAWFGDTRVVATDRRLVSDAQLAEMKAALRPGDIVLERRNWFLSNVALPGFWPHTALYVGTQDELRAAFDDAEVVARYGDFSAHLAAAYPDAWAALATTDEHGPRCVIEAVSEGVVAASFEHSCAADYVAALRPRLPKLAIARAIDRACALFGRPYDFDFDFATDDAIVCSELVAKAFEPSSSDPVPGLRIPFVTVLGRAALPPTEIVRAFAAEHGKEERQLDFVWFLDGRESTNDAVVADAAALAASAERPKWDLVQP